jgi:hypothetical protein
MKKLLLSISLCSVSTVITCSYNQDQIEYELANIKNGSYKRYHNATQAFNEITFNAQSESAKNKNNPEFLAIRASMPATSKAKSQKPIIGSAAWAKIKNTQQ